MKKNEWVVYCDGFVGPKIKPRPGASIAVRVNAEGTPQFSHRGYLDEYGFPQPKNLTTNDAEWFALFLALDHLRTCWLQDNEKVIIYMDSMLVVQQYNNRWKITKPFHHQMRDRCHRVADELKTSVLVLWISRKANVRILGH